MRITPFWIGADSLSNASRANSSSFSPSLFFCSSNILPPSHLKLHRSWIWCRLEKELFHMLFTSLFTLLLSAFFCIKYSWGSFCTAPHFFKHFFQFYRFWFSLLWFLVTVNLLHLCNRLHKSCSSTGFKELWNPVDQAQIPATVLGD